MPFPSPGHLPDPGIEPTSPALAGRFLTTEPPGKPKKLRGSDNRLFDLFSYIQSQLILGMSDVVPNWVWYTYWFLIRETDNKIIGFLSFKGKPDQDSGSIEIGYSLGKDFEHNGYMTKAVDTLCRFAEQYSEVKKIKALTLIDNIASQKLLIRCGVRKFSETPSSVLFIRRVKKSHDR